MTFVLTRMSDGAGDIGGMSMIVFEDENGKMQIEHNAKPKLHSAIRVGARTTTMFGADTWWQTTKIQEIIEEKENYVKFRTGNSIYEWYRNE